MAPRSQPHPSSDAAPPTQRHPLEQLLVPVQDDHDLRQAGERVVGVGSCTFLDLTLRLHQSEVKIGAADTAVTWHFSSHAPSAGKSDQVSFACW